MLRSNLKVIMSGCRHSTSLLNGLLIVAMSCLVLIWPVVVSKAGSAVKVDWNDPELVKFSNNAPPPNRSLRGGLDKRSQYDGLKLPVIGLNTRAAPTRGFFGGQAMKPPEVLMNKSNPVWYELAYEVGQGVVATVAADLRIQTELPRTTRTYSPSRSSADSDDTISIFDDRQEVGMIGAVAEFTLYKFGGVPYVVTVECTEKAKARCQNMTYLKSLRGRLEVVYANAPR